jgi:hypothetical protein
MKPLNLNKESCNPISSNCVVWQGPDIECINLCKGDSVTEVVYKLATELCDLLEKFNVDNYDISCFNLLECGPDDFEGLIQLLIDKVCACCGETPTIDPGTGALGCPDCEVNICSEFFYQNPQGDTITTMQLKDYVVAIGNRVCQLIGQIDTINSTLQNHETRIINLENAPAPTVNIPQIQPNCVLPSQFTDIDVVVDALEEQFCELRTATGDPQAIYQAILKQCNGLDNQTQLAGGGNMSTIPGWVQQVAYTNLSHAINNIWLAICDIRSAVQNIQASCCDAGCDGISISINAILNSATEMVIYFTGSTPAGFIDCPGASVLTLTDAQGGTTVLNIPLLSSGLLNDPLGYIINLGPLPVDGNYDIDVTLAHCFQDSASGSQCSGISTDFAAAEINCPVVVLTPTADAISYAFVWNGPVPQNVQVQLWDNIPPLGTQQQVNIENVTILGQTVTGAFLGLSSTTTYYVRLVIGTSDCPFEPVTTILGPCLPPSGVSATLIP